MKLNNTFGSSVSISNSDEQLNWHLQVSSYCYLTHNSKLNIYCLLKSTENLLTFAAEGKHTDYNSNKSVTKLNCIVAVFKLFLGSWIHETSDTCIN